MRLHSCGRADQSTGQKRFACLFAKRAACPDPRRIAFTKSGAFAKRIAFAKPGSFAKRIASPGHWSISCGFSTRVAMLPALEEEGARSLPGLGDESRHCGELVAAVQLVRNACLGIIGESGAVSLRVTASS